MILYHGGERKDKTDVNATIEYYNENAVSFYSETADIDFSEIQNVFLKMLPEKSLILDFGCGSGRDTFEFLKQGYRVEAIDGSVEMCRAATALTGLPVRQMLFQELDEKEKYDGIWACSSILHLPKTELVEVLEKMRAALKPSGIIYASFKYGDFEGNRRGRYFTDLTEGAIAEIIERAGGLKIEKMWITDDARPERRGEKWLNIILRKKIIY